MNSSKPETLRKELLDDFYAECDELLTAVREGLSQLENREQIAAPDPTIIEKLFRTTHTLKGNAAIVGLRPAEQIAHGMEDLFRALAKSDLMLNAPILEALFAAAQRLEKIVTAHRLEKNLPEAQDVLDQLREFLPLATIAAPTAEAPSVPAEAPPVDTVAAARQRGLHVYVATFTPSRELDQRGVNVKSVRDRLSAIGEIISATPVVREKGSFSFEFVVGLRELPATFLTWEADNVRFAPAPESKSSSGSSSDPTETLSLTPSHILRVDLARLDDLMRITGELVIQRSRLDDRLQQNSEAYAGLKDINLAFGRSLREMREAITRVRMVPIAEIFARVPFVVRDLARGSEKRARVALEDNQTEVDKCLVERLKEPLLHLVRNAFAHGIETATERVAAGKPAEATITLRSTSAGQSVIIQIRDDGRGVDGAAVVARAAKIGLTVPAQLDAASLLKILCTAGFSTRDAADLAAGRGVGMAVVANTVRELGGVLTLETWPGAGTQFTLKLPVSLSIAEAIIVTVGAETCAVPQNAVEEIIQTPASEVRTIKQTDVIPYRDGLLPVVWLRKLFGRAMPQAATLTLLVVTSENGATGLVVDRVQSQREVVIRPLADPLLQVPGISGATELGDGRPVLILDPNAITQGVVRPPNNSHAAHTPIAEARAS